MYVFRPPFRALFPGVILLLCLFISPLYAGESSLALPDLVLHRNIRPELDQPDNFSTSYTRSWKMKPPAFRRVYPVNSGIPEILSPVSVDENLSSFIIEEPGPDTSGAGNTPGQSNSAESSGNAAEQYNSGPGIWLLEACYNYRDDVSVRASRMFPYGWKLGAFGRVPAHRESVRPLSAGIFTVREGDVSGDLCLGGKSEKGGFFPFGIGNIDWYDKVGILGIAADGCTVFYSNKDKTSGGSVLMEGLLSVDTPLEGLEASLGIQSGLWGGAKKMPGSVSGLINSRLYASYWIPAGGLRIEAGADVLYSWYNKEVLPIPYLSVIWRWTSWTFSAGCKNSIEKPYAESIERERIEYFDTEIPYSSLFYAGFEHKWDKENLIRFNSGIAKGRFLTAESSYSTVTAEDFLLRAGVEYLQKIPPGMLNTNLKAGYFLKKKLFFWDASVAYSFRTLEFSVMAGSEDMVFGGGLPGLRSSVPIMGLGADWNFGNQWSFGLKGFTDYNFLRPAFELSVIWRSK